MDRERARELLNDYLDGELSAELRAELEEHLERCDETRAELRDLERTVAALGSLQPVVPPDNFLHQVKQKIRRRGKSPFDITFGLERKIPFEAVSLVLIGILLALYLLLVMIPGDSPQDPSAPGPRILRPDGGKGDSQIPDDAARELERTDPLPAGSENPPRQIP